jgi:hypothetical protein
MPLQSRSVPAETFYQMAIGGDVKADVVPDTV